MKLFLLMMEASMIVFYMIIKNKENVKIFRNSVIVKLFICWVKESKSKTIITLDGDCQNNPSDIPKLIDVYFKNNFSLVEVLEINERIVSSK